MASPPSPLDTIGREVTSIVTPVSVCMALTVLLVRTLNPEGKSNDHTVAIATAYYHEEVCFVLRDARRSGMHSV